MNHFLKRVAVLLLFSVGLMWACGDPDAGIVISHSGGNTVTVARARDGAHIKHTVTAKQYDSCSVNYPWPECK